MTFFPNIAPRTLVLLFTGPFINYKCLFHVLPTQTNTCNYSILPTLSSFTVEPNSIHVTPCSIAACKTICHAVTDKIYCVPLTLVLQKH